ncbi:MAG TPA: 16S rRNA (cytosine(1402)-N(4))-methyltransferase RsmH [Flavisolibacter sp.]|nr:16S rRNA (cytosine(1402)-N(4))-methyltransferase RsmH [Flavisolibacter sp.]
MKKQTQVENSKDDHKSDALDYHTPVLLKEAIEGLDIKADGVYVDCTFGGGGHSKAILEKLGLKGRLIAFDQDQDARKNLPADERILFVPHNFRHLQRFLRVNGITEVDGILADLGVSSYQFDKGERGFSIRYNGALDMRMDQRQSVTAAGILNSFSEQQLHQIFEQFGEVTNSKTLARTIVEERKTKRLTTIEDLKNVLSPIVKGNPNKYFAQVFQALRIEVNEEMNSLKELLEQLPLVLKKGGRAVLITFHSIEDRWVKIFFRDNTFKTEQENPFETIEKHKSLKIINRKPIVAKPEEVKRNPRSRSAKIRIAEKI